MKNYFFIILLFFAFKSFSQINKAQLFFNNLKELCSKSFEGKVIEAPENDDFRGKPLVMHVRVCSENEIRIPFFVGENKSRTWVLTLINNRIQLKHEHKHQDGTDDKITQYGGLASNSGFTNLQIFPADKETADLIEYASSNIWWITLTETSFTYNLRRIGTDRYFSISFDLTKPIPYPGEPWGL